MKFGFISSLLILVYFSLPISPVLAQERKPGSEIYEEIREFGLEQREEIILEEFRNENFPQFLLNWQEITTIQQDALGTSRKLSFFVSPDYLSVGNKQDYFIIPLTPKIAQKIANMHEASLATPKVVDLTYEFAKLKLEPFTYIPRGNRNESIDLIYDHSRVIQAQLLAAGFQPGTSVAGTKKDIVISTKLTDTTRPQHVTIYGWHKLDGKPIQPLYNGHFNTYVDYSHGVRLISNLILIDGKEFDYREILKDENLYKLLSDEEKPLELTSY